MKLIGSDDVQKNGENVGFLGEVVLENILGRPFLRREVFSLWVLLLLNM